LIKWRSPDRADYCCIQQLLIVQLIVVFNHNEINLCFTAYKTTMYTSNYDKVNELV